MIIHKNPAGRKSLALLLKGKVAEIGTERGKFAAIIAENCDKLYCIDLWKNYEGYRQHVSDEEYEEIFQDCKNRLSKYDVSFIREDSVKAASLFGDEYLDGIYLDANHTYKAVLQDLRSWWRVLKSGGICSGHDFTGAHKDVYKAVLDFCTEMEIEELTEFCGDKSHSYFFIKP